MSKPNRNPEPGSLLRTLRSAREKLRTAHLAQVPLAPLLLLLLGLLLLGMLLGYLLPALLHAAASAAAALQPLLPSALLAVFLLFVLRAWDRPSGPPVTVIHLEVRIVPHPGEASSGSSPTVRPL